MTEPVGEPTVRPGPPVAPWPIAAAAGAVAAGVALAVTELLGGLISGAPSVIVEKIRKARRGKSILSLHLALCQR